MSTTSASTGRTTSSSTRTSRSWAPTSRHAAAHPLLAGTAERRRRGGVTNSFSCKRMQGPLRITCKRSSAPPIFGPSSVAHYSRTRARRPDRARRHLAFERRRETSRAADLLPDANRHRFATPICHTLAYAFAGRFTNGGSGPTANADDHSAVNPSRNPATSANTDTDAVGDARADPDGAAWSDANMRESRQLDRTPAPQPTHGGVRGLLESQRVGARRQGWGRRLCSLRAAIGGVWTGDQLGPRGALQQREGVGPGPSMGRY